MRFLPSPIIPSLLFCFCASSNLSAQLPRWITGTPLPSERQEVATAWVNKEVIVVGGIRGGQFGVPDAEAFDPVTNTWRTLADLPVAIHHPGMAAVGDRLFVVGGLITNQFLGIPDVYEYDFQNDTWIPRTPMPTPRGGCGVTVWNGEIYVAGGEAGVGGHLTNLESYDPVSDSWTVHPNFTFERNHLGAGAVDNKIIVVAGRDQGFTGFVPQTEIYDIATQTWSMGTPIPTPRAGCAAATVEGKIYVFGGEGNVNSASGNFDDVEAYDPLTDTWEILPPMPNPRHGIQAAGGYLPSQNLGFLFMPGGADKQGFGPVDTNDVMVFRP